MFICRSDIIRICLLCEKGGVWIDSTILMTGGIDEVILNTDLFFYQASFLNESETAISSWFMYSAYPKNPFIMAIRNTLLNYWKQKDTVIDYFLFHLVVANIIESGKYADIYDAIPYYSNTYPSLLCIELNKKYNAKKVSHAVKMSNIHKLTYKNLSNTGDTFADMIIDGFFVLK